jgi:hypothetical protein
VFVQRDHRGVKTIETWLSLAERNRERTHLNIPKTCAVCFSRAQGEIDGDGCEEERRRFLFPPTRCQDMFLAPRRGKGSAPSMTRKKTKNASVTRMIRSGRTGTESRFFTSAFSRSFRPPSLPAGPPTAALARSRIVHRAGQRRSGI